MITDSMSDQDRFEFYRHNPWEFVTECCYTKDQVDLETPIKLLPNRDYAYIYSRIWQKYPLIALPKTRRMTVSWTTIALYLWDTIFHRGRFNAFVSKKEDDANELVDRAKFMFDHIPENKIPKQFLPRYRHKFCILDFYAIDSKIQGFPQGADQLRQFTFSGIFGDESAFWEYAAEFYAASFPTIEGGGKMTLVSSPAPGFFKKLCFDAMDVTGDINVAEYAPNYSQIMDGVRFWTNPKNKFAVMELHYTADPEKRHAGFKESIKNSMPLQQYLREYELHWDTFEGFPVYPEFQKLHVLHEEPHPIDGLPMLIGFDFGRTPAAVIGQMQEDQLVIFKEFIEINMGAERFAEKVTTALRLMYPTKSNFKKDWLCFIDPAGLDKGQTDETSCAIKLAKYFNPTPGPITWEDRFSAVSEQLRSLTKQGPKFQLYAKECPMLFKGFEGGYRFSEKSFEIEPNKLRPIKDAFSHPHDALQYLCAGVRSSQIQLRKSIPRASYSIAEARNG